METVIENSDLKSVYVHESSKLGLISLVLSFIAWLPILVGIYLIFVEFFFLADEIVIDLDSAAPEIMNFLVISYVLSILFAIALGIGALFQKNKDKTFALLGILLASPIFILVSIISIFIVLMELNMP